MAAQKNVVILGAGVTGLTTAYLLADDPSLSITVAAKAQPGDLPDVDYASPAAGANYLPSCKVGTQDSDFEGDTWPDFEKLATRGDVGVHFQDFVGYRRTEQATNGEPAMPSDRENIGTFLNKIFGSLVPVGQSDLPNGYDRGSGFKSVCINPTIYLSWLVAQSTGKGVTFRRGVVKHVSEAANLHSSGKKADLVVNCTGLGSYRLGGVMDKTMYPARGQTCIVRNSGRGKMLNTSNTEDGPMEILYTMDRASGGGLILGGTYQPGNWDLQPDMNIANRIMKRVTDLDPEMADGKGIAGLDVIKHSVGLRPVREGGIRLEKEVIDGQKVVHDYGHGGYGYQSSWACARAAVKLIHEALQ